MSEERKTRRETKKFSTEENTNLEEKTNSEEGSTELFPSIPPPEVN